MNLSNLKAIKRTSSNKLFPFKFDIPICFNIEKKKRINPFIPLPLII